MNGTASSLQPLRQHPTQRALSAQGHRQILRSSTPVKDIPRSASHPHPRAGYSRNLSKETNIRQVEALSNAGTVPEDQICLDKEQKVASRSSKVLGVEDFELMQTLGTGTFARVWLCRFKRRRTDDENRVYALKVLKKVDVIKLKQVEHVRNERNVLAAVAGHPFITQLLTTFSDSHSLYMLLEYTPGGEIFSYLRRARRFPFPTVQFYAAEITLILAYLHDVQHVAYRDLKPENILLDADGHLKLVDFGFAKILPPGTNPPNPHPTPSQRNGTTSGQNQASASTLAQSVPANMTSSSSSPASHTGSQPHSNSTASPHSQSQPQASPQTHSHGITYTLCGTPEYLAPEVIRNTGHTTAVDWWALGILVYEMLIGQPPFWDQNPMKIYEQIVQGHIRFPVSHHGGTGSDGRHRPSLHVPRAARDFILALCKTDPSMRLGHILGGSKRVMAHHFFEGINWDDIYYKRRRGPIIPRVEWEGDAGNFDEYPDPVGDEDESEGGRGKYTESMRKDWDAFFDDF